MAISLQNENTPSTPLRLPRDNYKVRCIAEPEFKLSKANNPMLVFEFEIVEPATKVVDGVERNIAGLKLRPVYAITSGNTRTLCELHQALGLPIDGLEQTPEGGFVGITYAGREGYAVCGSERKEQKKEGTDEVLTNPHTGEALVSFAHEIQRFHPMPK